MPAPAMAMLPNATSASPMAPPSCPCLPGNESKGETTITGHEESSWNFVITHWGLLVGLLIEIVIVFWLYIYHVIWTRRQTKRARSSGVRKQSEAYAIELVRHFLPSIQVEKYRFRGLKRKTATVSIAFEDLGLELANGSKVLHGVTGEFKSGRMCAIMGPSGAGKTTFMNVLCGKATYGEMTGHVYINDEEGDISDYKSVMGFVPQDDVVHEGLTVSEQIAFSAQLRGPPGMPSHRCKLITEDVLSVMQIDHIRNSIVGGVESRGISGGQRKRVNIGLELAADPTVLFLDEPTSGLDATSSLTIVHSLKKLTQLGMTAIMVIHQPRYSLFTLFDDVLLLGKGGQTVYLGPSLAAKPYFESIGFEMPADANPADWFMDVISGEVPNLKIPKFHPPMLFDLWEKHGTAVETTSRERGRRWTVAEDRAALASKLEEEWDKIDHDGNGVLDETELFKLLTMLEGQEPDRDVVADLFGRMTGPHEDVVSRQAFLNFLVGLQEVVTTGDTSTSDDSCSDSSDGELTFVCEQPFSPNSKSGGKFGRGHRGCRMQALLLLHRRLIQWWRNNKQRGLFLGVIVFAAFVLGIMDTFLCEEQPWAADPYLNLHTALALLTSVFCLGVFGSDRPVFWRESSSGLSVIGFYFARVLVNSVDLVLQCFLFSALYYLIRQPDLDFHFFFIPFLLVTFASSGVGYFLSTVLPPQHGPFVAALVSFVSCGLLGHPVRVNKLEDGSFLEIGMDLLSITRWSVGMSFLKGVDQTPPTGLSFKDQETLKFTEDTFRTRPIWQESLGYWRTASAFLLGMGITLHVAGYLGLRFMNRDKQV